MGMLESSTAWKGSIVSGLVGGKLFLGERRVRGRIFMGGRFEVSYSVAQRLHTAQAVTALLREEARSLPHRGAGIPSGIFLIFECLYVLKRNISFASKAY